MSEINPGIWDGLTPDQARKYYPQDWERFVKDPYSFRAPRAESYHDLSGEQFCLFFPRPPHIQLVMLTSFTQTVRIEPLLIELEREKEDLLIIGHASVIRCLLAYLIGLPASEIPAIEIARGDLLEVVPASYGVHCKAFHFWDGPGRRVDESLAGSGGSGVTGEGVIGEGGGIAEGVNGVGIGIGEQKDPNNFYENYAEDTKGKRTNAVTREPEASIGALGVV